MFVLSDREIGIMENFTGDQWRVAYFLSRRPDLINVSDNDLVRGVWSGLDPDFNCSTAIRYRRLLKSNPDLPSFANYDQERVNEADRASAYHWGPDGQARAAL